MGLRTGDEESPVLRARLSHDGRWLYGHDESALNVTGIASNESELAGRAVEPQQGGTLDLMVASERSVETVYGEFNVLSTANQRTPKVSAIRKYVDRGVATEDYNRLPSLCRLAQAQRRSRGTDNPGDEFKSGLMTQRDVFP